MPFVFYFSHQNIRKMRLYQHTAHCSVALQIFLDRNPNYWCFIPRSLDEVEKENALFKENVESTDSEGIYVTPRCTHDQRKIANFLARVPLSRAQCRFSHVQYHEQRLFFDDSELSPIDGFPYIETDLYQMKIIAICK